ncbi:MAG: serine hydrolase domain-containing protein [Gammaproteobacteria bacterium]
MTGSPGSSERLSQWRTCSGLVVTSLAIAVFGLGACTKAPEPDDVDTAVLDSVALFETLDQIAAENGGVAFAIGLVAEGNRVYTHAYGEREIDGGEAVTNKSVFHWASVSKPFVATAIMQLHERGKLDLDALLIDVLSGYEVSDRRLVDVTIRQLLLHTSGMPDVEDYGWDKPEYDDTALRRWVLQESPRDLLFDPGSDRQYSNVGFEVLGLVIEQVSGLSFEEYMQRNIFKPLDMDDSTFYYPDVPEALQTAGHEGEEQRHPVANYPYNRRHAPSSTLNTNVEDMARFVMAMLNNGELNGVRIIESSTLRDMWDPKWVMRESPLSAASMGWVVEDFEGHRMVRHFGGDDGFRSALLIFPDDQAGLFLVTNDEAMPTRDIARTTLNELLGGNYTGEQ